MDDQKRPYPTLETAVSSIQISILSAKRSRTIMLHQRVLTYLSDSQFSNNQVTVTFSIWSRLPIRNAHLPRDMATPMNAPIQGQLQLALISENITESDVAAHSNGDPYPKFEESMRTISIKSCNPSDPAYLFSIWGYWRRPRRYVTVHDPRKCKCIARGKVEPIIRKPDGDTTTPASENIFRMLYFRRADGIYRNALGQAVKDDDGHNFGSKRTLLKDLCGDLAPNADSQVESSAWRSALCCWR